MHRIGTKFALALSCLLLPAWAQDAAKLANIEEMFRLIKMDKIQEQTFIQLKAMLKAQMQKSGLSDSSEFAAYQDRLFSAVEERLRWDKMKPAYIKLYDETFTAAEIAGVLEFYKTPAGTAFLEKTPVLMKRSMELGQQQMAGLIPEMQRIIEEVKSKREGNPSPSPP